MAMAMAAQETAFSLFSSLAPRFSISTVHAKPSSFSSAHSQSLRFPSVSFSILPFRPMRRTLFEFQLCSAVQEISVQEEEEKSQNSYPRKKLFVLNLPWSLTVEEIKNVFGACGTVADVEIIKQKDGKSRGFAFITMGSGEEAQAVLSKFDSQELFGRILRVDFAKRLKKPAKSPPPPRPRTGETPHKIYVSNLAWKVRSTHLRELFSSDFNPLSTRVVFENSSGRSSGYGFVAFATKEEADSAISSMNGKELMGRPIRLKISERNVENSESENGEVPALEEESGNGDVPALEESEQS